MGYYGRLIAQAVTASIHLRRGAGGFSISPNLNCSRVVSSKSPLFQLVRNYCSNLNFPTMNGSTANMNALMRQVEQLFQDRQASVRDVNESGSSVLHVGNFGYCSPSDSSKIE